MGRRGAAGQPREQLLPSWSLDDLDRGRPVFSLPGGGLARRPLLLTGRLLVEATWSNQLASELRRVVDHRRKQPRIERAGK